MKGRRRLTDEIRMSRYIARWTKGRTPAELAASAARATFIAVVPGVLWIWLAWCLVRELNKARLRLR